MYIHVCRRKLLITIFVLSSSARNDFRNFVIWHAKEEFLFRPSWRDGDAMEIPSLVREANKKCKSLCNYQKARRERLSVESLPHHRMQNKETTKSWTSGTAQL